MSSTFKFTNKSRTGLCSRAIILATLALPPTAGATGDWNSIYLMPNHEFAAIAAPEFWFELEMKDLAKEFPAKEKSEKKLTTEEAELETFDAAVEDGKFSGAKAKAIRKQLAANRKLLSERQKAIEERRMNAEYSLDPNAAPVPEEKLPALPLPEDEDPTNEFELYQLGALCYANSDIEGAVKCWEAILDLPDEEKQYRAVWAEYMIGRANLEDGEKAAKHFANVRKLVKGGYPDPLGLAAASYGWEAHGLAKSDPEEALKLYLTQLATGDADAFTSVKQVVRNTYFGSYYAEESELAKLDPKRFAQAADSPLLRKIITRWHLAMGGDVHTPYYGEAPESEIETSQEAWLKLLDEKGGEDNDEADRMGWLAYRNGNYDAAKRWLKLADADSKLSLWLTAKLALREGDTEKAATAASKAAKLFTEPEVMVHTNTNMDSVWPKSAIKADQARIQLSQSKFAEAMASFIAAGYWRDAAWIAERVLTLDELKEFVDSEYPDESEIEEANVNYDALRRVLKSLKAPRKAEEKEMAEGEIWEANDPHAILEMGILQDALAYDSPKATAAIGWRLRWLLARRMVREDREPASRAYFPPDVQPVLDAYVGALEVAAKKDSSPAAQARSWWEAGWIARYAGLEIMGMEMEPDNAWEGGSFECELVSAERQSGLASTWDEDTGARIPGKGEKIKFSLPPSAEEKKRLEKHKLSHENRHHYRWVAAVLARKAANLLKDGTEEKADALNTGGSWLFNRDVKGEELFFFEIKRACPKTQIGKAVLAKGHTFELGGPWSGTPVVDEEENAEPQPEPEPEPKPAPPDQGDAEDDVGYLDGMWEHAKSGLYVSIVNIVDEADETMSVVVGKQAITIGGPPPVKGRADDILMPVKTKFKDGTLTISGNFNWDREENSIEATVTWDDGAPVLTIVKNAGYARFKEGTYELTKP